MPLVKLYANLRKVTGHKELSTPGLNIHEVLERLVQDYPAIERLILDEGHLRPRVVITVNGQTLGREACLQTSVSELDHIAIFPPVGGG